MFVVLVLFAFCSLGASQTTIGTGIANFGLDLYKECAREHPGDIIISPLSVSSVLTLLSQAANGTTFEQLQNHLFPNIDKNVVANQYQDLFGHLQKNGQDSVLSMVNEIYVKKGHEINPTFSKVASEKFMSGIESLNFAEKTQSARTINDFVKNATRQKIVEIIKPDDLNADTELVLLNAIYFKANWENKFDKNRTKKDTFYMRPNHTTLVDFMQIKAHFGYVYWRELQATVLEMKYANSSYSFVMILPDAGVVLSTVESKMNSDELYNLLVNDMFDADVDVKIPKFGIEYEVDLKPVLEKLGMGELFKSKSDLSGLLKADTELKVSKAVHKAVIEVNEDGSEASGATAIGIESRSGVIEESFIANRPFMYFIRDTERNVVVFSGRVEDFKSKPAYLTSSSSHVLMSSVLLIPMLFFWAFNTKML